MLKAGTSERLFSGMDSGSSQKARDPGDNLKMTYETRDTVGREWKAIQLEG